MAYSPRSPLCSPRSSSNSPHARSLPSPQLSPHSPLRSPRSVESQPSPTRSLPSKTKFNYLSPVMSPMTRPNYNSGPDELYLPEPIYKNSGKQRSLSAADVPVLDSEKLRDLEKYIIQNEFSPSNIFATNPQMIKQLIRGFLIKSRKHNHTRNHSHRSNTSLGSLSSIGGTMTKPPLQCAYCGKPGDEDENGRNFIHCENCVITQYCCDEHQQSHWNQHRPYCLQIYSIQSDVDALTGKAHRILQTAIGHQATVSADQVMEEYRKCLLTIYDIYKMNADLLRDGQRSKVITVHMQTCLNFADLLRLEGRLAESESLYKEAMLIYENDPIGFRRSHVNIKAWILRGMAEVSIKRRQFTFALEILEKAYQQAYDTQDHLTLYHILCAQANTMMETNRLNKAAKLFEEAMSKSEEMHNKYHHALSLSDADLYSNAGICYSELALRSAKIFDNNGIKCVENTPQSMIMFEKSQQFIQMAIEIIKKISGRSGQHALYLYRLAQVKSKMGQINEAWPLLTEARALLDQSDPATQEHYLDVTHGIDCMIQSIRAVVTAAMMMN